MSICVEYSEDPSRTSGGRYQRVTTSLEYVLVGTDLALARPADTPQTLGFAHGTTRASPALLTEVSQFELAPLVNQQVLRLQVPVENFPLVTIRQPSQNLEQEDLRRRRTVRVINTWCVRFSALASFHSKHTTEALPPQIQALTRSPSHCACSLCCHSRPCTASDPYPAEEDQTFSFGTSSGPDRRPDPYQVLKDEGEALVRVDDVV